MRVITPPLKRHTTQPKKRNPARGQIPLSSYATILLSFDSEGEEVAYLALPFAQFLNPEICSAISFDSGIKSVSTWATVRSVGSVS
jgi:hypothetical protein